MKKFATIAALMATAFGAFAQGQVDFKITTALVTWGANGGGVQGSFIDASAGVKVGLYYKTISGIYSLVSTQFPIVGTSSSGTANIAFNGKFTGNPSVLTINGLVAGTSGTFEVRAWNGNFTSYEAASSGGATYLGKSGDFTNPSGGAIDPGTGLPGLPAPLSGFTGLAVGPGAVVPEPSTLALAGLGLGALLLIRRRK